MYHTYKNGRATHRKTSNSRHTLNGNLRFTGLHRHRKKVRPSFRSREERHMQRCSLCFTVHAALSSLFLTRITHDTFTHDQFTLKKWAVAICCADTFQPAADLLPAMLRNLIQIILIQRHDDDESVLVLKSKWREDNRCDSGMQTLQVN